MFGDIKLKPNTEHQSSSVSIENQTLGTKSLLETDKISLNNITENLTTL